MNANITPDERRFDTHRQYTFTRSKIPKLNTKAGVEETIIEEFDDFGLFLEKN